MPARHRQRVPVVGSRSQLSVNTLPAAAVAGGTFEIKPLDADPAISVLTCDSWRISLATEDAEDPLFVDIICGLLALRNYPSTAAAIRDRMVARKRGGDTSSQETLVKEEDDIEVPSETLVEQRIRHHIAASPHTVLSAHGTLSASASSPSSHNAQQGPFYYISQEGVPVGQDLSIVKVPSRHLSLPPMKQAASFDDLALLFSRGRKSTATGSDSVLPEEAMEDGDSDLYKDSSMAEFLLPSGLPSFSFDVSEFEEMIPSPPVTPGPDSLHPNSLTSRGRRLSNVRDPQSLSTDELDSLLGPNSSGEAEGEAEGEEEENGSRRATRSLRKRKADGSSPRTLLKKTVIENISELEVLEQESDEKSQVAKEQIDEEDDEGFTPSSPVIVSRSSKAPTSRSVPSSSSSSSTSTSRIPPLNLTTSFSQERLLQPLLAKVLDEHDIFDFDLMETTINPTKNLEVTVVEDDDDNEEAMSTYNSEAAELASVSAASDVTDTPPNISSLMDFSSLRLVSPARSSGNYVPVWATVLDNRSVYISWLSTEGLAMGTEDSFPLLRRADNDLVNATLILHAVGLSEQVQSVILSLERTRIRCADRKSPLFGVWIPLHRAVELATSCCIEGKMRQFLSKKLKEHFVPPRPVAGVSTRAASAVASQPPPQQPQPVQAPKMEQRGKTPSNVPVANSTTVTAAALLSKLCQMGLLNTLVPRGTPNRTALASLANLLTTITNSSNGGSTANQRPTRGTAPTISSAPPTSSTSTTPSGPSRSNIASNPSMAALYEAVTQILAAHNQNKGGTNNGHNGPPPPNAGQPHRQAPQQTSGRSTVPIMRLGATMSNHLNRLAPPPRSGRAPPQGPSPVGRSGPSHSHNMMLPPQGPQPLTHQQQLHQLQHYQMFQHQQQHPQQHQYQYVPQLQHLPPQGPTPPQGPLPTPPRTTRRTIHIAADDE